MLYVAIDPLHATGAALDVVRSRFAPPADALRDWRDGHWSTRRFESVYNAYLKLSYVRFRQDWFDLVEHAALDDVTLVGEPAITGVFFRHLVEVGGQRGAVLEPVSRAALPGQRPGTSPPARRSTNPPSWQPRARF